MAGYENKVADLIKKYEHLSETAHAQSSPPNQTTIAQSTPPALNRTSRSTSLNRTAIARAQSTPAALNRTSVDPTLATLSRDSWFKRVIRFVRKFHEVFWFMTFVSLSYFTFTAVFWLLYSIDLHFWENHASLLLNMSSIFGFALEAFFLWCVHVFMPHLRNLFTPTAVAERTEVMNRLIAVMSNLAQFVAAVGFPLLSLLEVRVLEKIMIHVIAAFVLTIFFYSLAMSEIEGFGFSDAAKSFLMGMLLLNRNGHKVKLAVIVSMLPATSYLFVPGGMALSKWADAGLQLKEEEEEGIISACFKRLERNMTLESGKGLNQLERIPTSGEHAGSSNISPKSPFWELFYPIAFGTAVGMAIAAIFAVYFYGPKGLF